MKYRIWWRKRKQARRRKFRIAPFNFACDETLAPDTLPELTNLAGAVTDIDEPVDNPDGDWLTLSP